MNKEKWRKIWTLARNDFKSKYAVSQLGIFWAFFRPVMMACVYILVFSVIARSTPVGNKYPYALWMLPGLIVWFAFSDSVSAGTTALKDYSWLVKNIRFDISLLPAVKVVAAFIVHTFFAALVFVLYLVFGLPVKASLLQLPYYYAATFLFSLACVRIVSTVWPFFKDLSALIEIVLMIGIWACPIMWNLGMIPEKYHIIFQLNPMYHLVLGYRDSFMGTGWIWDHSLELAVFWAVTLLLWFWGRRLYRLFGDRFADVL
ncbi:MAG: ABC transporter permease [Clostridia bacterium]|nr:ABC transporter permease [Clostridia bacterium]